MYKFNKTQTIPSKIKEKSTIFALCVNCEEFIPIDRIDLHAQICTQVSNKVLKFVFNTQCFEENDFKLKKLKTNLQNKNYQHTQRLCRICELVTQINSIGYVEEASLIEFEQELQVMNKEPISSINLSLYIARLHSLVIQRIKIIQNQLNSKVIKPSQSQQNFYSQPTTVFNSKQSKISTGSTQTFSNINLQNLLSNKFEQSQILVTQHQITQSQIPENRMTTLTRFSQDNAIQQQEMLFHQTKGDILYTNISEQSVDTKKDKVNPKVFAQRCFYSKVINCKLGYSQSSPAQKIPVSLLWKLAVQKQIKSENWDLFIQQCLDNPFEYVDPKKFDQSLNNSTSNQYKY